MSSRDLRSTFHSAFATVRSGEVNKSAAAYTLDHAIDEQINFLKPGVKRSIVDASGLSVGERLSRYDSLDTLQQDVKGFLAAVRKAQESNSPEDALQALGIYEVNNKYLEQNADTEPEDPMTYGT